MGYVIRMPQMGMSMEEGTVVSWAVDEGDAVEAEEVLCVVESEKTSADVEAREPGVLRSIVVPEGGTVEPGAAIGILAEADEPLDAYRSQVDTDVQIDVDASADTESAEPEAATAEKTTASEATAASAERVRASPGARSLADAEGVDLTSVEGTGPQGVITEDDVRKAVSTTADTDAPGSAAVRASPGAKALAAETGLDLTSIEGTGPQGVITETDVERATDAGRADAGATGVATRTVADSRELSGMQRTISDRLGESYREAVHVTLNREYDTAALRAVVDDAAAGGVDVSLTDPLLKAVGNALADHPAFNATFEDGEHALVEQINVGVAVDVEAGLVAPVIGDVDGLSVEAISRERARLTERVQSGEFTMDDLAGGTFTVTNLGVFGVDHFDPIINPPQVAILGLGRIRDDGTMTLSLSFDHRVVNGADAARFLDTLIGHLTDESALRNGFDASLDGSIGDDASNRTVRVRTESRYAGTYRASGAEIGFDEPESMGGGGTAPDPVAHLLGALGACLSLSVRAMAERDDVAVGRIETDVDGDPEHGPLESVTIELRLETDGADEDVERVVTKAERACYVARTLTDDLDVSLSWTRL